jgi:hypothetical protein
MKITGLYCWSAMVEVEVPDDASDETQRAALYAASQTVELDFKHPILHECSNSELID